VKQRGGPEDLIDSVKFVLHPSFEPRVFVKNEPPFQTKQTSYGSFVAQVKITLSDGTRLRFEHELVFRGNGASDVKWVNFNKHLVGMKKKSPMPLDTKTTFGVEIELSTPAGSTSVYDRLRSRHVKCQHLSKSQKPPQNFWKITQDSSIRCSDNQPNCQLVEIISPVLSGGTGLSELHRVLQILHDLNPSVNKSMGVHIHIGAAKFTFGQIRKICQQFLKHEASFDMLVPKSRRGNNNSYARSNRLNPVLRSLSNKECNDYIASCSDMKKLNKAVSPDRYYKLNLHSLDRHGTLEFRQHSGSTNYKKLGYWIRLLVAFCNNAARLPAPQSFKSRSDSKVKHTRFEKMFQWVVKDGGLRVHFKERASQLENTGEDTVCCESCEASDMGSCCSHSSHATTSSRLSRQDYDNILQRWFLSQPVGANQ